MKKFWVTTVEHAPEEVAYIGGEAITSCIKVRSAGFIVMDETGRKALEKVANKWAGYYNVAVDLDQMSGGYEIDLSVLDEIPFSAITFRQDKRGKAVARAWKDQLISHFDKYQRTLDSIRY